MKPDFDKDPNGLLPAIVQHAQTGKVLMLGYMNSDAFQKTHDEGLVTFFSRSKQRLWTKGESSGNTLQVVDILIDCDADSLLVKAIPAGPTCHLGNETCFNETSAKGFLHQLEATIADRKANPREGSYTNSLFEKGTQKISQKVGEEAVETILEAMDGNRELLIEESSDLLYHLLVLFADQGISLEEVEGKLKERHQ